MVPRTHPARHGHRLLGLAVFLVLGLPACHEGALDIRVPEATPPAGTGRFLAGASTEEITPVAGLPMGGHGFAGQVSRGRWGPLQATATYFEDARGHVLVLASVDMWAVSEGLRDRVLQILAETHAVGSIGRAQLVLAASHTHQSPGAIASNVVHNERAASKTGFDREAFDFTARRIAGAISAARKSARPAKLALGEARLLDVARNRSPEPFAATVEAKAIMAGNPCQTCQTCTLAEETGHKAEVCRMVVPQTRVVRVVDLDDRDIAVLAFVDVHATAMPNRTRFYQPDIFGIARARIRDRLSVDHVAIFNGAEGDVSPTWDVQGYPAAMRIETAMADAIASAAASATQMQDPAIQSSFGVFDPTSATQAGGALVAEPRIGCSVVGGAEDGRTWLSAVIPEGKRRRREVGDHGIKSLLPIRSTPEEMAPHLPLTVGKLGDLAFVTVPGEATTLVGARARADAARSTPSESGQVVVIGLANGYRSYFTTPDEYELQHYEGGATLYGEEFRGVSARAGECLGRPMGRRAMPSTSTRDPATMWAGYATSAGGFNDVVTPRRACRSGGSSSRWRMGGHWPDFGIGRDHLRGTAPHRPFPR